MSEWNEETGIVDDRTPITSLIGKPIASYKVEKGYLKLLDAEGNVLLMSDVYYTYDGYGNRFAIEGE